MSDLPPYIAARFPEVSFGRNVQFIGLDHVDIGRNSCVGDGTWFNVAVRDGSCRLVVGRNVLVGRWAVLSTACHLELGDYCLLAPRVYVADTDHVYTDITRPYMTQGVTASNRVTVEENCWLCVNSVITGNVVVGRGSVVAANAVVKADVPPFAVVAGAPARIVKLFNPETGAWESASRPEDRARLEAVRADWDMPDREAYRLLLAHRSKGALLHPVLAGGGVVL
jgi:acetyltransferase-like isoleucine patch superfamily enzyme